MLQVNTRPDVTYPAPAAETQSPLELIEYFSTVLRLHFVLILSISVLVFALGALYVIVTPPTFTARATMLIDRGKVQAQLGGMARELPVDPVEIESQIQLIKSEAVALTVIRKLNLGNDPEFTGPPPGLAGWLHALRSKLVGALGYRRSVAGGDDTEADPQLVALGGVSSRLVVNRIGGYVIEIEFRSLKAEKSAQIANAFADCYLEDQLNSRYFSAQQAATWLQDRMRELNDQSSQADAEVVRFKAKNNIVAAGGRLINDQQLAELNTQLIVAREKTSEARARLDRIEDIIRADSLERPIAGTVSETLSNPIIVKLRSQYLELINREMDFTRRFGKEHLAVVNLGRQIREIRRSMADELSRIAETYKSDYEIARQRQAEIERTVAGAVARSQEASQAQIELRRLESSADTYRGLYKSSLQRNAELIQQQSFPGIEARVVTRASTLAGKSNSKSLIILFGSAAGGVILGFAAGVLRASLDRVFRTSGQVEAMLQTNCVALVPALKSAKRSQTASPAGKRVIVPNSAVSWEAVNRPLSRFAEAMRSIRAAADLSGHAIKVFGFTSSLPDEGKTTISAAFALRVAQGGARTLLIDCDLRNPALTATLAPSAKEGLLEVVSGKRRIEEVLWKDEKTHLAFLPGATGSRMVAHSSEFIGSKALRAVFAELRQEYDYVVVDLPPVAPIVDVLSTAGLIDAYVFVVEWGRTKMEVVDLALSKASVMRDNLLGVVLNKVDFKILGRHEGRRSDYYSEKYYARYGEVQLERRSSFFGSGTGLSSSKSAASRPSRSGDAVEVRSPVSS